MAMNCRVWLAAASLAAVGCRGPHDADEPVWDPDELAVYRLEFDERDWESILADYDPDDCDERVWVRATLTYENPMSGKKEVYEDVAVRYRGHNTFVESGVERRGYKISFNEFTPGGRFHDLRKINLLGTEGDYTLMRERLALGLMEDAGVPAPRINHALLYIDGKFEGVFPNSEEADDEAFVDAHFDGEAGSLYKVKGYCGHRADLSYEGVDPATYSVTYEPKADTEAEDMTGDLIPMLQCASEPDDATFAACIEGWLDVDEWLAEIAVDMALPDVDGMAGAGQNFMLWRPEDGRFRVYPWDKDLSFYLTTLNSGDSSIWTLHPEWLENSQPALVNRLRTVYRERFCAKVVEVADLYDPDRMGPKVDELEELLDAKIKRDPFIDHDQWRWSIDDIQETLVTRHPQILAEALSCSP